MICQSGRGLAAPSGTSASAKTDLSDVEILRVALLEIGDAERAIRPSTIDAPNRWAMSMAGMASPRP